MSRIVFCWELGGNLGHTGAFLPLGHKLRERGHEVILVLQDLPKPGSFENLPFAVLQAPFWKGRPKGKLPTSLNYADLLKPYGWLNAEALYPVAKAWRDLFTLLQPDGLILNAAPTAALGSRGLGVPRAIYGSGYHYPPLTHPLPAMRYWENIAEDALLARETQVLNTANGVLHKFGEPEVASLAELLAIEENLAITFPELDHYGKREGVEYLGPVFTDSEGVSPKWKENGAPKFFAYIQARSPFFDPLMHAVNDGNFDAVVYARGIDREKASAYPNIAFAAKPLRMKEVTASCDIAACHASHGTVGALMLAGVPLLLLPNHLEQLMLGRRAAETGGVLMMTSAKAPQNAFAKALKDLTENPRFAERAKSFAKNHQSYDSAKQKDAMAERIEAMISNNNLINKRKITSGA